MNNNLVFPISPFSPPGKDNFCYWEGFLSENDINFILARPEWHDTDTAKVGGGGNGEVVSDVRRTSVSWLPCNKETHHIYQKITTAIWNANRQYFQFDLTGCYEMAQLGVYTEGDQGHYDWHTDTGLNTGNVPRKLSFALLLSDPSEFEGGELLLKVSNDKELEVEQKKGRAWIFPSWTLHKVAPVTKGIRRSLVLWVGGPAFK